MRVRTHNDLNQWLKFFLTGVIETAKKGVTTFDGILQLQKALELKVKSLGNRSGDATKVIDYLYTQPVIEVNRVEEIIQKSNVTAYKLIDTLEKLEILKEVSGAQRNKLYVFNEYLNLFNRDE
jgi:Fic family protein